MRVCVCVKLCLGGGPGALDPNLTCLTAESSLFRSITARRRRRQHQHHHSSYWSRRRRRRPPPTPPIRRARRTHRRPFVSPTTARVLRGTAESESASSLWFGNPLKRSERCAFTPPDSSFIPRRGGCNFRAPERKEEMWRVWRRFYGRR